MGDLGQDSCLGLLGCSDRLFQLGFFGYIFRSGFARSGFVSEVFWAIIFLFCFFGLGVRLGFSVQLAEASVSLTLSLEDRLYHAVLHVA